MKENPMFWRSVAILAAALLVAALSAQVQKQQYFSDFIKTTSAASTPFTGIEKLPVMQHDSPVTVTRQISSNDLSLNSIVETTAALKLMSTATVTSVIKVGYYVRGDMSPVVYTGVPAACSLNSGTGDGGAQIASQNGKCWVASFPSRTLDPLWFGARADTVEGYFNIVSTAGNACVQLTPSGISYNFSAADVGRLIRIEYIGTNEGWVNSSIASVPDSTHICLVKNATQTVGDTGAVTGRVFFGSDSWAQLQATFDTAAALNMGSRIPPGHFLVSRSLNCPIPYSSTAFSNNFFEPPPLCQADQGAVVSAMAEMDAVISYGSSDYTGYIQNATLAGGLFDAGFVAQYAQAVPFAIHLKRMNLTTKNSLHAGLHYGDPGSPTPAASLNDNSNSHSRDKSEITVIGCVWTTTYACTTAWDHGFGNQSRARHPVVAILGSNVVQLGQSFFSVVVTGPRTFTLDNVNAGGWVAFTGTATVALNMPTAEVALTISGITAANPAVVTVPNTANLPAKVLIADVFGLTTVPARLAAAPAPGPKTAAEGRSALRKCVDGVFPVTVLSATTFSVPVNASDCTAYTSGGTALPWVDPTKLEAMVYIDNATDIDILRDYGYGIRVGIVANPANSGWDSKASFHFYNYPQNGELLAGMYLGGDNNITNGQVDCPARFGYWFVGPRNTVSASSLNCAGFTWNKDNYAAYIRLAANAAEGSTTGRVTANIIGGSAKGQSGGRLLYDYSSNFPYTPGYNPYGDELAFSTTFVQHWRGGYK